MKEWNMKKATIGTTLATVASLAFASPAFAQSEAEAANDIDFGPATGQFTTIGFNAQGEPRMRASERGFVYDSLAACLQAGVDFHESYASSDSVLFNQFDIATRVTCSADEWGRTITSHYGSPLATSRLRNMLP